MRQDPYVQPWKIKVTPTSITAGADASILFEFDRPADSDTDFNIAANPPAFFVNLPDTGTLPQGASSVTIVAQTSVSASRNCVITSSVNGGQATGSCSAVPNVNELDQAA